MIDTRIIHGDEIDKIDGKIETDGGYIDDYLTKFTLEDYVRVGIYPVVDKENDNFKLLFLKKIDFDKAILNYYSKNDDAMKKMLYWCQFSNINTKIKLEKLNQNIQDDIAEYESAGLLDYFYDDIIKILPYFNLIGQCELTLYVNTIDYIIEYVTKNINYDNLLKMYNIKNEYVNDDHLFINRWDIDKMYISIRQQDFNDVAEILFTNNISISYFKRLLHIHSYKVISVEIYDKLLLLADVLADLAYNNKNVEDFIETCILNTDYLKTGDKYDV
jgi:hypothetical protein